MAAEMDESSLDLSDFDVPSIIQLQAYCRRWLVRRQLKHAQQEFEQLVHDIDGPTYAVEWTESRVPQPTVTRLSRQQKRAKTTLSRVSVETTNTEERELGVKDGSAAHHGQLQEKLGCALQESVPQKQTVAHSNQEVQTDVNQWPGENNVSQTATQGAERSSVQSQQGVQGQQNGPQAGQQTVTVTSDDTVTAVKLKAAGKNKFPLSDAGDGPNNQWLGGDDPENRDSHSRGAPFGFAHSVEVADMNRNNNFNTNNSNLRSSEFDSSDGQSVSPAHAGVTPTAELNSLASDPNSRVRIDSFFGDQTSVWDSSSSLWQDHGAGKGRPVQQAGGVETGPLLSTQSAEESEPNLSEVSTSELKKQRQNIAMELLWVQQAIISRKKYLRLKSQMDVTAPT
ncbi:hypothetical protein BaRGS_00030708 [Batillaria attramentaria]|uniref:Uncharacterized protein n=1 Tax=Batillaria attramentaria TaxID=370345 RepID=A0ABD0JSZ8_9CAEN